jgi:glycosyltransferase 2 family protein
VTATENKLPRVQKGKLLRIAVAVVFTIVVVVLFAANLSFEALQQTLDRVELGWMLGALVAYLAVTALRALRFMVAGARLRFLSVFGIAAIHAALLRVMPLRSGELAYGILLKRHGGGGFSEGIAAIFMLRILDLAAVLPLVGIVLVTLVADSASGFGAFSVIIAGLLLGVTFFALGSISRVLARRIPEESTSAIVQKIGRLARMLVDAYDLPLQRRLELLGLTVVTWGMVLVWFFFTMRAAGVITAGSDGLVVSVLGISGSILPLSLVGSFGAMESGFALGMAAIGSEPGQAAAGSLVISALTFVVNWVVAISAWGLLAIYGLKKAKERSEDQPQGHGNGVRAGLNFVWGAAFCVVGALFLLLRKRYGFETTDQFQYLLLPYRSIYPDFLLGDWFTWETTHYHTTFAWLIRGVHWLVGQQGLPYAFFSLHLLTLAGVAAGLWQLARAAKFGWFAAVFALFAVAFVRAYGVAGAIVNHGTLLPADMALPMVLLGMAAWLRREFLRAGLWLGLAGLFHANFAVLGPLVIGLAELPHATKNRAYKDVAYLAGGYLVLAWPNIFVIVMSFLFGDATPQALEILFHVRSSHHYAPALGSIVDVWWLVVLAVAGLPVWMAKDDEIVGHPVRMLTLALVLTQVLAAVATWLEWNTVVRLFFWRLSVPLGLILALAAGAAIKRAVLTRRVEYLLFCLGAFILVIGFAAKGTIKVWPEYELKGFGTLIPALIPLTIIALSIARLKSYKWARWATGGLALATTFGIGLVAIPGAVIPEKMAVNWEKAYEKATELHEVEIGPREIRSRYIKIYDWVRQNTPSDALFLIPPGNMDFRLRSMRGVYVDWKCCPMKGDEIIEWRRRMFAAIGATKFPATGYRLRDVVNRHYYRQSLSALTQLARSEGLQYIMAKSGNASDVKNARLKELTRHKGVSIYQVLNDDLADKGL